MSDGPTIREPQGCIISGLPSELRAGLSSMIKTRGRTGARGVVMVVEGGWLEVLALPGAPYPGAVGPPSRPPCPRPASNHRGHCSEVKEPPSFFFLFFFLWTVQQAVAISTRTRPTTSRTTETTLV